MTGLSCKQFVQSVKTLLILWIINEPSAPTVSPLHCCRPFRPGEEEFTSTLWDTFSCLHPSLHFYQTLALWETAAITSSSENSYERAFTDMSFSRRYHVVSAMVASPALTLCLGAALLPLYPSPWLSVPAFPCSPPHPAAPSHPILNCSEELGQPDYLWCSLSSSWAMFRQRGEMSLIIPIT